MMDDRTIKNHNTAQTTVRGAVPVDAGNRTIHMPAPASNDVDNKTIHINIPSTTKDKTFRNDTDSAQTEPNGNDFVLKGKVYHNLNCLSDHSGEAQVFLVNDGKDELVLKLYYPNFSVNKQLLRIIQNSDPNMVVQVLDFGKTYVDGKSRDYELMEYLQGGSLAEFKLDGNFDKFRRVVLKAAASLAYCHNNRIIHKDIKPGNFFFRNADHTELVLGDFGISSVMQEGEHLHKTTQARTPVYAAPEMYNDVIDGEVEITPSVDFYSLGISLMTLWLGENPLVQNERALMRRKSEGRLPRINELPERVRMVVQGLTAVNPQNRWGYDQVERWFLGENVVVDITSPLLKYKSFVVDPERNLVAENIHELIPMLVDNERLAINYLYYGRIANWLEQCGNVKLSSEIKDIVTNRYPINQYAGLMAAVYVMEPSFPYRDIRGKLCDSLHSVALSLLKSIDEYSIVLRNQYDSVYLYVESHSKVDVNRLRSYFQKDSGIAPRVALIRVAYEIDDQMPFLATHPSSTLTEIVQAYGYGECSKDEWMALSDGRLLSWMYAHEDRMACESLRIMTEGQKPSRTLGYKVLYNIDRRTAYDLREANTPAAVGEVLAEQLKAAQYMDDKEFEKMMLDYTDPNGRFYYFAQLHGWIEQIGHAKACFDMKSDENRERMGSYDLHTAAYRFCRILGAVPTYLLEDGRELTDARLLDNSVGRSHLIGELKRGTLSQWMSVFYHENPEKEFQEAYSYERSVEDWISALGEIDPNNYYYKRYCDAKQQTSIKYQKVMKDYNHAKVKEKIWRIACYALCALWVLLLITCGVSGRDYLLSHSGTAVVLPLGGVLAAIIATRAFFNGFGFMLSCLWGSLGLLSTFIPVAILRNVQVYSPGLFVPVLIAITAVYMLICHFTDYRKDRKNDALLLEEMKDDDVKTTLLEPLYFTFKQKNVRFKGSKFSLLDDVSNQVHSISGESVLHYMLWSLLFAILVFEMVAYNPHLMNIGNPDLDNWRLNPTQVVNQLQKDVE